MAALEQLSLCSGQPSPTEADVDPVTNGRQQQHHLETGDEGGKAPRLPRWTRQEILVLIQGKREVESRVRRGRAGGLGYGLSPAEPKWASVSSYCKRHGVNRGPVQCRKRWSNLAGDFKKIKEHESRTKDESESFWVMRNDIRRERKLPGFFDKEVYDILYAASTSGASGAAGAQAIETVYVGEDEKEGEGLMVGDEVEAADTVFDSGKSAIAAEDGLFSDFEQLGQDDVGTGRSSPEKVGMLQTPEKEAPVTYPAPTPISEKRYEPFTAGVMGQGTTTNKQTESNPEIGSTSQEEGRKRKRSEMEGDPETTCRFQEQLIQVLERNGRVLCAQLEAQNTNLRLEREQRKELAVGLLAVLDKLANALSRIADKM